MRRAERRSTKSPGSKSRASQAMRQACAEASKRVIGPAPDSPASAARQVASQPIPRGPTIPRPVTTTRRPSGPPVAAHSRSPPLTASTAPVMKAAAGEQRNATGPATSSGLAQPAERRGRQQALALLVAQDVGEARAHEPGGDGVDAHARRPRLAREGAHQAGDAGLRGGVVGLPGVALGSDDRGDGDHAAAPAAGHARDRGAGGGHGPAEVDVDGLAPRLAGHPHRGAVPRHAGVRDHRVERPDRGLHLLHRAGGVARRRAPRSAPPAPGRPASRTPAATASAPSRSRA